MNRLTHLLRSQTAYHLHSPYIYRLYTQVLIHHRRDYDSLVQSLARWSSSHRTDLSPATARLQGPDGEILVLRRPHADKAAEQHLHQLQQQYPVSIDLYRVALLIRNPKLHPQQFILR